MRSCEKSKDMRATGGELATRLKFVAIARAHMLRLGNIPVYSQYRDYSFNRQYGIALLGNIELSCFAILPVYHTHTYAHVYDRSSYYRQRTSPRNHDGREPTKEDTRVDQKTRWQELYVELFRIGEDWRRSLQGLRGLPYLLSKSSFQERKYQ